MKKLLLLLIISLSMIGCALTPSFDDLTISQLSDSRFNGNFFYNNGASWPNNSSSFYSFDGTNKVYYISDSDDSLEYTAYYQFEVKDGMYRKKLWDNSYDEWSDWHKYEFITTEKDWGTFTSLDLYNTLHYDATVNTPAHDYEYYIEYDLK